MAYDGFYSALSSRGTSNDILNRAEQVNKESESIKTVVEGLETSVVFNAQLSEAAAKAAILASQSSSGSSEESNATLSDTLAAKEDVLVAKSQVDLAAMDALSYSTSAKESADRAETAASTIGQLEFSGQDNGIPHYQGQTPGDARLFIGGIDSLTDGAGGTDYHRYFKKIMRGCLGDGGPGLQFFDAVTAKNEGSSFGTGGLSSISENDGIYYPYSLAGKGMYSLAATSGFINWMPKGAWETARVFYLKQSGGGTFNVGTNDMQPARYTTVDTAGSTNTLAYVDVVLGVGTAGRTLAVREGVGKLAIFGALFVNKPTGFLWGNIARGGRKLMDVAAQDSAVRRQWFNTLTPTHFLFNGGANDRTLRNGVQHMADLNAVIDDVQAASPTTSILLIQHNQIANSAGTYDAEHARAKIAVAKAKSIGYRDDKKFMGTYADAVALGLMFDGTHPSDKGNKIRAVNYAEDFGFSGGQADPGVTPYGSGGSGGVATLTGKLSTKKLSEVAIGSKTTAYTFGIVAGYPSCAVDIKVYCNRHSTRLHNIKRFLFSVSNGITSNAVNGVSTPTIIPLLQETESTATIDFTLTAEVINSKCVVSVTPSIAVANFIVEGEYAFTHNNQIGQALFES